MNKRKIRWIIILMSPALLGVIAVQVYWINNDIQIKEKQLDQNVRQAMNAIVDRIETNEAFNAINTDFFNFDSISYNFFGNGDTIPPPNNINENTVADNTLPPPFYNNDESDAGFDFKIVGPGSSQMIVKMQRSKSLSGNTFDEKEWKSDYTLRSRQDSIQHIAGVQNTNMHRRLNRMQRAMNEMVKVMMQKQNGFYHLIDQKCLDKIVQDELYKRGIDLTYNYGIASGVNDSLILVNKSADKACLKQTKYRIGLLPNDFNSQPDYLVMNFQGVTQKLLSAMLPMLLASLLFTLTVIIGFSYSINTIIRQKKLSDIKNDFINNMTHEFKTPIATISLAADAMTNPKVIADKQKLNYYTHIISEENKRMNVQVENVLKMSQFEKGELSLKTELVNINELISKVTEGIALQVEEREGKIACHFESEIPNIHGDPIHLSNVISNLIDNANKYSTEKPEITISTRNTTGGVIVNIIDKGIGMTRDTLKKIFEKFYRVQSGNIHDIKGFGLGLSYVKAIIEQHRGTINVTSEPGRGSNFEIFLPY